MADTKNGKTRQGENTSVTKLKRRLGKLILTENDDKRQEHETEREHTKM